MPVLKVEGLSKNFGGLQVLQNISFDVKKGEKVAIIGPNGAGKTTLFNVLGGQLSATGGHIFLSDKEITRLPPNHRLHLGLARSYQLNNLFFRLSLLENMLLALYGAERSHIRMFRSLDDRDDLLAAAHRLLEPMGLWEKRYDSVATLSYGDQRLVEIALALASQPQIVVLDEPSAGLPTAEATVLASRIRTLSGEATLLFCAHDMDLVFNLADTIMVLYFGQIIAHGGPQEIKTNQRVQEIYLGSEEH